MRTLVLAAGVLLVVALVVFLAVGKWKNPFIGRDIPKRLGIEIQQEANGVTYTQAHGGHTLFKIHASKVVQLKKGSALLHDVRIELYGEDGSRVDRIEGNEFEYDQKNGTAKAEGPVEITLMRPGVAPAIAPKASARQAVANAGTPLASVAQAASAGQIRIKTSGLTFDQNSGVATTAQRVEFALTQGSGSAMGASYDSQQGLLVLESAVLLNTVRGSETLTLRAQHAEFEREARICRLRAATADYRGGQATAGDAKVLFRDDGSAVRLDATGGFTLATSTGSHVEAPAGQMDFDQRNRPRHGHLAGGVILDSASASAGNGRKFHGTAPTADLEFTAQGELRRAHLERDVQIDSQEQSEPAAGAAPLRLSRRWRSPVADVEFRSAGQGRIEPVSIHGSGGVTVNGESQRGNGPKLPSRLYAGEVTGDFGPGSVLTTLNGVGHAGIEETTQTGARQTVNGDRLEAHFAGPAAGARAGAKRGSGGAQQLESAAVEGHVVLVQEPMPKPGAAAPAQLRATSGRAVYDGDGEWLHLTKSPRVEDGALQLTADKVDVSQASGDAFAHGNVKASWVDSGAGGNKPAGQSAASLGGQGPAHAIAAEAQLHQASGEATFRGQARLWQQANSITAPVIVLDRTRQTMEARSTDPAEPVRAVLLSAGGLAPDRDADQARGASAKPAAVSVIRLRGGDLRYSDAERKAVMHGGVLGSVVAETGTATSSSNEVELLLQPSGSRTGKQGAAAQVDRLIARGHVALSSMGRRGSGEQLVFTGETGEYVLTGTATQLPRLTDPARGTVTGEALIFNSRDDSVRIEGGARKTTTETTAPK